MNIKICGIDEANVKLNLKKYPCGTLVTPTVNLPKAQKLDKIEFVFNLPKQNALVFNNGFCTNGFVEVLPLTKELLCRDIVMVKAEDGVFSCGMITANRFLTQFFVSPGSCALRQNLENKEYSGEFALEAFLVSDEYCGGDFFAPYCDALAKIHNIHMPEKIDTGWSSWSYYYRTVTEDDCREQEAALRKYFPTADLIQIDDAWQVGSTFSAEWVQNGKTFKSLEKPMGESRLGLWMSPTLADNTSNIYKNNFEMIYKDENGVPKRSSGGNLIQYDGDGSTFPLDISKESIREHIADSVLSVKNTYNCNYFKLDFLIRSLLVQSTTNDELIIYKDDTNVALYKKTVELIRKKVGRDTFLMACGAPITESVGVFDGIRTSPDITWCREKDHIGYWYIIKRNIQNIFLRSYYHGKVFICDPDALITRCHPSRGCDDFHPTLEEARVWASVVALSGGTVLINEDINALEPERLELIKQVIEPIGVAALPDDFFEMPYCGKIHLTMGDKTIYGLFNLGDEAKNEEISLSAPTLAFDCWTKEYLGAFDGKISFNEIPAHSCRVILLVPASINGFVASCDNIFMGINKEITSGWYNKNGNVYKK